MDAEVVTLKAALFINLADLVDSCEAADSYCSPVHTGGKTTDPNYVTSQKWVLIS